MSRRAKSAGRSDGIVHATLGRSCDPTGGFIKRHELGEDERFAYVEAYRDGYGEWCQSEARRAP